MKKYAFLLSSFYKMIGSLYAWVSGRKPHWQDASTDNTENTDDTDNTENTENKDNKENKENKEN